MKVREAIVIWRTPSPLGIFPGPPVRRSSRRNRECLAQHLVAAIGDVELAQLDAQHVWAVQTYCLDRRLSVSTTNAVTHSVLRALLRDLRVPAEVRLRIAEARRLRPSKVERARHFDHEQRDRAIVAFEGTWAHAIVAFGFLTGCRIGEIAGLQWDDVDLRRRVVRISRQRVGREIGECKTAGSHRVLRISERLAAILATITTREPDGFVFRGRHGGPFDVHTFRAQLWYPTLRRARLPRLPVHGMRHSWATIALTAGMPLAQVAAHLGDTEDVVRDTYSHVLPQFDPDLALGGPPPVQEIVAGRPRLRLVKG